MDNLARADEDSSTGLLKIRQMIQNLQVFSKSSVALTILLIYQDTKLN